MSQRDPYEVLGIGADATGADIVRAWRRLARALHPDSQPGDPAAAAEFQTACDAYGLLSDPARRAAYDYQQRARSARRPPSPGGPAAGPALWPFPPVAVPDETADLAHGASLRVGPVSIEPLGPPGARDRSGREPPGSPAVLAWLAYWLLADPRERPW
jgi:curved DNA-binding protein CbpA